MFSATSSEIGVHARLAANSIEGQFIETQYNLRTIRLGEENRAFIQTTFRKESVEDAYMHPYLGGSVAFDVDVREVGCGCRAGVYLTTLNDSACTWDRYVDEVPRCSTIDLMEAHRSGFSSRTQACSGSSCSSYNTCEASAGAERIGPDRGPAGIDTDRPYSVKVSFWAEQDENGTPTILKEIRTELTQWGHLVQLALSCAELGDLTSDLRSLKFATSLSTSHVDEECPTTPCKSAPSSWSNFVWTANDALYPFYGPDEKVDDGPADYLDAEGCGEDCAECRTYHMKDTPLTQFNECVDKTKYIFTNQCNRW